MISDALLSIFGATNIAPIDPYFANVDYLIMVDGGSIVDKSNNARAITNNGGVTVSGNEMVFNGSNHLSLLSSSLGSSLFTIEIFATLSTGHPTFSGLWSSVSQHPSMLFIVNNLYANASSGAQISGAITNDGLEKHYCLQFDGANLYLMYDGTLMAQMTYEGWITSGARIGKAIGGDDFYFLGSIRAVRATLGVMRYAITGFTPPTSFPTS